MNETKVKYDEIISLGSQCNPGLSLRKLNLKRKRILLIG